MTKEKRKREKEGGEGEGRKGEIDRLTNRVSCKNELLLVLSTYIFETNFLLEFPHFDRSFFFFFRLELFYRIIFFYYILV